jgi:hypothetical protein
LELGLTITQLVPSHPHVVAKTVSLEPHTELVLARASPCSTIRWQLLRDALVHNLLNLVVLVLHHAGVAT